MTSTNSRMRQTFPLAEETFSYQLTAIEGAFTFLAGEEASPEQRQEITVSIDSRQAGEGLCHTSIGPDAPLCLGLGGTGTAPLAGRPTVRV